MKWPQAKVSRVERGARGATLSELLALGRVFGCSMSALLGGLEAGPVEKREEVLERPGLSPGFFVAFEDEDALAAQLARQGVRFLGSGSRPALVALPVDETALAALRYMNDPRVFEALPALLLKHASESTRRPGRTF